MVDIKSLPDEILIEIFGNLSQKMIKTCSLVCKRWDGIIAETTTLMEKFRLNLEKPEESIIAAMEIRRKHQSAWVEDFSQDTLDVICKLNLKSLVIFNAEGVKVSTLIQTLKKLPALMTLDASYVEDDISNTVDFKKIHINLKELRCCVDIIHIFDCCTLKKLELMSDGSEELDESDESYEPYNYSVKVLDFLSQQKDLQELILDHDDLFSTDEIFRLQFSLKTLRVSKDEPFRHYERFIQFLQLQKRSLTGLKLRFSTEPPFGIELIQNFVIENMTNLKHLNLGYSRYSHNNYKFTFKDTSPEMYIAKNIESLDFSAKYDLNDTKRFFEMLPNLKRLTFISEKSTFDVQLLLHISAINTKLEALSIAWLDDKNLSDIHFPNLKELKIKFWTDDVLCTFINRHSETLEKIILRGAAFLSESAANEIMNCKNMKSLELSKYEISAFSSLAWLRDITSKVSSFTFTTQVEFRNEIFKFPDDKAIRDEKIKNIRENFFLYEQMYEKNFTKKIGFY